MDIGVYEKYMDEKGLTKYQVSKDTGISRATLSQVFNGKQEITVTFMLKFGMAYGFYPDGVKLPESVKKPDTGSASPKEKKRVPAVKDVIDRLRDGVEERIKKVFGNKPLPKSNDEFVDLMVKSWATGVKDAVEFFASANAEE